MIAVFATLGWSALPHDVTASGSSILLRDSKESRSIGLPVFVLRENGSAVRFGEAAIAQGGSIRIGLYDPLDPLLGRATEAVSLPGDPRLLWLLASPSERQSLRDATAEFLRAMPQTVLAVLQSPEFVHGYRDSLVQRLRADLEAAWQTTRESGAWQELLRGYEPILRDTASRELRPIIESRFRGVPMRMLRANALQLIDPFGEPKWNMAPVEEALQTALQEVQERGLPERTVTRLLKAQPTTEFLQVFVDAMARELATDAALRDLVSNMVLDERFRSYLGLLTSRAMDLARVGPRLLVSLHGSTDLNPVASYVVRTLVSGRFDRVVVFMSPAQRDELMTLDADAVHPLARLASG